MNEVKSIKLNLCNKIIIDNIGNKDKILEVKSIDNFTRLKQATNNSKINYTKHIKDVKDLNLEKTEIVRDAYLIITKGSVIGIVIDYADKIKGVLDNSTITLIHSDQTEAVYSLTDYIAMSNITSNLLHTSKNNILLIHAINDRTDFIHTREFNENYNICIMIRQK